MPDDYEDDENELDEEDDTRFARLPRDQVRRLEKKAKLADKVPELEQQLASYERRDVFRQAGIDPDDAKAKWFAKGYDGDLSVDAVKAAAVEGGFLTPEAPDVPDGELQAHQAVGSAAAGAVGNQSAAQDAAYDAELAATQTAEQAMQVMVKYGKPISTYQQ